MNRLPQLERLFLTDGGLETDLIFNEGIELPHFASIVLVSDETGRAALVRYYEKFLALSKDAACGFILESPTWRASPDWAEPLGFDLAGLADANRRAIELMRSLREQHASAERPIVISGCVGPRGDGYQTGERMTAEEARAYHAFQARAFSEAGADLISGITITYVDEAIGITRAALDQDLPAAISFTTETDGRLPDGQTLAEAIEQVDAATGNGPAYYMINCAHPDHFSTVLQEGSPWSERIRGVRANASRMSHAELDGSEVLDIGDPEEFGGLYADLRARFPGLSVLGGCCGTDHRHLDAVRRHCA